MKAKSTCKLKEQKNVLENSNTQTKQVVNDKKSQLKSPPETVLKVVNLPDLFREDYRMTASWN